jgi:hypothetical protein
MRTLIGAAEPPEPPRRPGGSAFTGNATSVLHEIISAATGATVTVTPLFWYAVHSRAPYRTVAFVDRPKAIEGGEYS